jgi:transcriptional regulator with XRE-family HTH domain
MDIYEHVAVKIRELRENYGGPPGISQQKLAERLDLSANTISRWETASYRPSLEDLDKLARFFGVSILVFFPSEQRPKDERLAALLRTARQLKPADVDELQRYAEFRRARNLYPAGSRPKPGRKRKQDS